jgi:hypothetical protein
MSFGVHTPCRHAGDHLILAVVVFPVSGIASCNRPVISSGFNATATRYYSDLCLLATPSCIKESLCGATATINKTFASSIIHMFIVFEKPGTKFAVSRLLRSMIFEIPALIILTFTALMFSVCVLAVFTEPQ